MAGVTGTTGSVAPRRENLARGTIQVVLADALALPANILAAVYLARALGPGDFGLLMIATSVAVTIEWALNSMFSRATVKFVSDADDWRAAGAAAFTMQTGLGVLAGLALFAGASPVSRLMHEPAMAGLLRWLAAEIAVVSAAAACRNVLTGRGRYRERATAALIRWTTRPLFMILLVGAGLSLTGAVLGSLLSAIAGWMVAHAYAGVPLRLRWDRAVGALWRFVLPLFTLALSLRLIDKMGLVMLLALGLGTDEAGWYAAAQGFSFAPSLIVLSFTPLLLGAVARAARRSDATHVHRLVRNGYRLVAGMAPFLAFGAAAAPEIVRLIYGPAFAPAATLVLPMLVGALAVVTISVSSALLAAGDRARQAATLVWPVVPALLIGLVVAVPRWGTMGAAVVTSAGSIASAVVLCVATCSLWRVSLPWDTIARSVGVSTAAAMLAVLWPTEGFPLLVKGVVATALIPVAFGSLREFDATDWAMMRAIVTRPASEAAALE